MEIALPHQQNPAPPVPQNIPAGNSKRIYFYIAALLVILAVFAGIVYLVLSNRSARTGQSPPIIAKAGEENIYQEDLEYEISQLPPQAKIDKKQVIEKIVTDSIILQAGKKMNSVALDKTIFNNPNKDYPRRIKAVQDVTKKAKEEVSHISGTAILLFFINNSITAPKLVTYDKAKSITLEKISRIRQDIVDKKLTVDQAIAQIQNDTSLEQIDASYKSNAAYPIEVEKGQEATRIKVLNDLLWELPENSITDIYTDKGRNITDKNARPTGDETYYTFVVLNKKVSNESISNYDNWLSQQKKAYEVIYY